VETARVRWRWCGVGDDMGEVERAWGGRRCKVGDSVGEVEIVRV